MTELTTLKVRLEKEYFENSELRIENKNLVARNYELLELANKHVKENKKQRDALEFYATATGVHPSYRLKAREALKGESDDRS